MPEKKVSEAIGFRRSVRVFDKDKEIDSQIVKKFPYLRERSRDVRILVIGQKLKNFFNQDIHILIGIMME